MDIESRKLTNYQLADTWGQIDCCANQLVVNFKKGRNLGELNKTIDKLLDLQKKLKWHEVALTIEKGEQK